MKLKNVLAHIVIGLGIGSVIFSLSIAWMSGVDNTLKQVLVWLLASALYGVVSLLYDTDFWPLPVQIAVHLLLCCGITLATAWKLYGDSLGLGLLVQSVLPGFLVVYVVISLILFAIDHRRAREINEKLK